MTRDRDAYERWIWTELIGFDNLQRDFGVGEYLETTGFVPDAICLLMSSVDFVLLHKDIDRETPLPMDFCSREGHERNQVRERQVWTNHQLRRFIEALHRHDIDVYLTVFTQYFGDRHHREWASDHPEVRSLYWRTGHREGINSLKRLKDGGYYEDFFAGKLLEAMDDYGFDGWHGADGYGPLSGAIYDVDFSDDMVDQFIENRGIDVPEWFHEASDDDSERLGRRARWIWRNRRRDWIEFYVDRWTRFWEKMVGCLHGAGKKAVINSAWGRAPFESLYRYGIDYRKIADTGVDGIIVETVAAALTLDPRCGDAERHYDFLSMLMLIKAYVPNAKLIFLHNAHDIVEQWDVLRHGPTVLEKEIYSLANVHHIHLDGTLDRCVDGLLVCLGDGIRPHEWRWLQERWRLAFSSLPKRTLGVTLVWSGAVLHSQIDDFTTTRTWTVQRLLFHLMARGAPIQSTVDVGALDRVTGPILLANAHLFPPEEQLKALSYRNGPIILIGREMASIPHSDAAFEDVYGPNPLWCGLYGATWEFSPMVGGDEEEEVPPDLMAIEDPGGYWDHFYFRKVSERFLDACVQVMFDAAGCISVVSQAEAVSVMLTEEEEGRLRLAVKNKLPVYAAPQIDLYRPIEAVTVLTEFPLMHIVPEGSRFTLKVPGHGIVVLDVVLG